MSNFLSRVAPLLALLTLAFPGAAGSQVLPSEPIRLFDGRVRLGGEVTVTFGAQDDEAFFNFTDYERNTLRTIRLAASGIWQPATRLAFLGEVRTDDFEQFGAYAAYLRLRPWHDVPLDIQAGRIPPVFGAFGRRVYQSDQILIGYPLAYQYLTSIRPDSLPATADDLLQMRGRGWLSNFPIGGSGPAPGRPLISAFRWDTGVQAQLTTTSIDAAMAVTTGTLSDPRFDDNNGGKQVVGRLTVRPVTGLEIGGSAARGAWISDDVPLIKGSRSQEAFGADVEYSRDYWLVRSELVWSSWNIPFLDVPPEGNTVSALGAWVEGRYRLTPRLDLAARFDRLTFSRITGAFFGRDEWDAPITRVEFGGGYSLQRNLVLRAVVQTNRRDGGRIHGRTYYSTQMAWWF